MPLTAAHLRRLADEIEAEEAELERQQREAESQRERDELQARLDRLEQRGAQVEEKLEQAEQDEPEAEAAETPADELEQRRTRTRPGRKHGELYQDEKGGPAYIWDGEDEPDRIEIDDEDEQESA